MGSFSEIFYAVIFCYSSIFFSTYACIDTSKIIIINFFFLKEEKLDQVLGHFQKDFEGGAFAENLGK